MKTLSTNKSLTLFPKFLLITAILLFLGFILKQVFEAHKIYDIAKLIKHTTEIVSESIETQNKKTKTKTKATHGNSDKNCKLHLVYEIYAKEPKKEKITLKYGITSQCDFVTKDGNPRPEYQIPIFQAMPKYSIYIIQYKILHRNINGRVRAKEIEQQYVDEYFKINNEELPEQKRPIPTILKKIK